MMIYVVYPLRETRKPLNVIRSIHAVSRIYDTTKKVCPSTLYWLNKVDISFVGDRGYNGGEIKICRWVYYCSWDEEVYTEKLIILIPFSWVLLAKNEGFGYIRKNLLKIP